MQRKSLFTGIVLLTAGLGAAYFLFGTGANEATQPIPTLEVDIKMIKRQNVDLSEEFPARVTAHTISEVRPQVNGIIQDRLFTEGTNVKKGQQLYQIDPAPFTASFNSAKAALAKSQATVKATKAKVMRYKDLVKIEAVSKQEYDDATASLAEAEADIQVAQANLEQAKINLDYTKVYAPIDGRIGKSSVTPGALVQAGQTAPLATITKLNPIYIDIAQSAEDMQRLHALVNGERKQEITLLYKNGMAYEQKATLQFTDITVDQTTGALQLRAIAPNPKGELLPGTFLRARLNITQENALLIPQKAATRASDGTLSVWVVDATQSAQPVAIEAQRAVDDQWLVTGGIEAGATIVTEGMQRLTPGAKVSVLSEKPAEPSAQPVSGGGH